MEKTEFFWGAYTKLDNFYAISKLLGKVQYVGDR
jgi:hypothetical protein